MIMKCDGDCTRAGWIEAIVISGCDDLHISHHPDVDLDDHFEAFCHDVQEMISIKGWMIEDYALIEGDKAS